MPTIRASAKRWFLLIQEPRVVRLAMFVFYAWTVYTGIVALTQSPDQFFRATGVRIVFSIAGFFIAGGLLGAIAILPGLWWLERIGVVAIAFGLGSRAILIFALAGSAEASAILGMTVLLLIVRWITIRRADLAPISR